MWAQSAAEIANVIATARRHRGLTQAQLASATGVTQAWISQIEQGKDTAQIGKILRLLSFLGVRLRVGAAPWLSGESAEEESEPGTLAQVIATHAGGRPRRKKT